LEVLRRRQDSVSDPRAREQFERSGLDRGRTGLMMRLGLALYHPRRHPVARELDRRE
jgi:hypothetical protein